MKAEQFIAVRYLFAGRRKSVVNIISLISLGGLLVCTAALIIVLSVYNGIGNITKGLFNTFDPELMVRPAQGKTFALHDSELAPLFADPDVQLCCPIVEENAWITFGPNQAIVALRGVDPEAYRALSPIDTLVSEGSYDLGTDSVPGLLMGGIVYYNLGIGTHTNSAVAVHIPRRGTTTMGHSLGEAFNIGYALPMGNFFIQEDIDSRYVLTNIGFVRWLMHYEADECTALALQLRPGANAAKVKARLREAMPTLRVVDRYDQQPLYYKVFRTERLGIYLVLSLIVLISTLSLVASLSLLIISKRDDIHILRSLGMTDARLRKAFAYEGLLICAVAVVAGLVVGFVVCLLQQQFGLVRMGDGNFIVQAFPVAMRVVDFVATFLLVMLISSVSVLLTVRRARL